MVTQTFTISYNKNQQQIISAQQLKDLYLYGLKVQNQYGTELPDHVIDTYIYSAQTQIEHFLDLKLNKQIIKEKCSFYKQDFDKFGFVNTTYPVVKVFALNGMIGTVKQITYPIEWLYSRATSDGESFYKMINIVPFAANVQTSPVVYGGFSPYLGYLGQTNIPHYWEAQYCTGFDKIPTSILSVIGKIAVIQVLHQLGVIVLSPGVSSISLGVDGLSQSISTTKSAQGHAFSGIVNGYLTEVKDELSRLKAQYKGIIFQAL